MKSNNYLQKVRGTINTIDYKSTLWLSIADFISGLSYWVLMGLVHYQLVILQLYVHHCMQCLIVSVKSNSMYSRKGTKFI